MTVEPKRDGIDRLGVLLASTPNRRSLLKALLLGSAAAVGIPWAVAARADAAASNNQTGTCTELSDYRGSTGVTDSAGNSHAGYSGWTEGKVNTTYKASWTGTQGWTCPCPQITDEVYPDQSSCDHVCHPGLGGCLVACGGGGVCLETKPLKLKMTVTNTISRLSWAPAGGEKSISAACRTELRRWNTGIDAHEAHHAADNTSVVNKANQAPAKRYKACGKTEAEAEANLLQQLNKAATDASAAAQKEMNRLAAEFHASPAGAPINDPDCGICG
ncbi:hypothetical protein GCM10009841_14290 [Microlunatus panaciterrae]|uniref:Uncharacterized protein n=1 Tax=Microlunatus panaciterrae TaxID=400768 RepID=A0ABS2RLV4_9ACTN|nr:hypothetical protein [Microlunatus panaciterrae]MBM7799990.1 hypothetical protein [Microlunatus panaciterrae]